MWALVDLGVRPGDKIVWCGQNSTGIVEMMNAARKIGATAVPLNYRLSDEEAAYVVDHCDATTVSTSTPSTPPMFERIRADIPKVADVTRVRRAGARRHDWRSIRSSPLRRPRSGSRPRSTRAAHTMIYTSGTTGKPKGALPARTPADPRQGAALLALIGYRPDDIYLTTGPLYHSGPGRVHGESRIAIGHTVVLQRKFDPQDWLRLRRDVPVRRRRSRRRRRSG